MGTGAFATAEAERTVSVEVAGDESAWIQLHPESKYAKINEDDALELDFTEHPDFEWFTADGINPNAKYVFEGVFAIRTNNVGGHNNYTYHFEKEGFDGVDVTIESGGGPSGQWALPEGTNLTEEWVFEGGPVYQLVDITLESEGGAQSADGTLTLYAEERDV